MDDTPVIEPEDSGKILTEIVNGQVLYNGDPSLYNALVILEKEFCYVSFGERFQVLASIWEEMPMNIMHYGISN